MGIITHSTNNFSKLSKGHIVLFNRLDKGLIAHLVDDFLQKTFGTICWTLVTIISFKMHERVFFVHNMKLHMVICVACVIVTDQKLLLATPVQFTRIVGISIS
jgi:hypothetical protein